MNTAKRRVARTCRVQAIAGAPVASVWQVIADVTRTGEWSHECHHVTWLGGATAAAAAIRCRSSVSAALRSMCRGLTRATIHSHQRGHLVTWKVCTMWVPVPAGSRVMRQSLLSTNSGVGMVRQAI